MSCGGFPESTFEKLILHEHGIRGNEREMGKIFKKIFFDFLKSSVRYRNQGPVPIKEKFPA